MWSNQKSTLNQTCAEICPVDKSRKQPPLWGQRVWLGAGWLAALLMLSQLPSDARLIAMLVLLSVGVIAGLVDAVSSRVEVDTQVSSSDLRVRLAQLLDAVVNSSTDAIYAKDLNGAYLFANREMARLIGKPWAQLQGLRASDVLVPEDADQVMAADREVFESGRSSCKELSIHTSDGERIYMDTKSLLRNSHGQAIGLLGIRRDITVSRREQEVRRQWGMAFENTRDGVIITDAHAGIQMINRAFTDITGYTEQEAVGQTPRMLQSGRQNAEFYRVMWHCLNTEGYWQGEVWNRRKNGEEYPEWLTISAVKDDKGVLSNFVGVFTDVARIKRSEAQLAHLSMYDVLTGLPNRRALQQNLEHALAQARRHGAHLAVLCIDLDGFKTVNDSLGHPMGDEVLVCMSKRLKSSLREADILGRLGDDEFLVVLEQLHDAPEAATIARALLEALAEPVHLSTGHEAYVTASIGISLYPDDGSGTAVEMLRDADAAMHSAKEQGRNRFCFYTRDLNAEAVAKLDLEVALSRALVRNELRLFYQPKVDAHSGRLVGAEALLRWQREGVGLVSPGVFIPIAERSSLILDIGAWVIDHTCQQIRQWLDEGYAVPRISVNVAARQFAAGDLDTVLSAALTRHTVPAQYLEVELTESSLMEQPGATAALLHRIKALGVAISLDDFGTGYSSLAYLQRFPIDALKIDQSFVRNIGKSDDGAALVDAIIALAHRLHLQVVAEGVETPAQRDYLVAQSCNQIQGYLFGRPDSAAVLAQAMQSSIETAA